MSRERLMTFGNFTNRTKKNAPFSVGDSIADALSIFSSSLKNHGIQVEFEYRGQQMAIGFPNEFSQVVLNILTNSRDAFIQNDIRYRKRIDQN